MAFSSRIIAVALFVAAFFAYAAFPFMSPAIYNSPDDHANAFFIKQFVEHGELWYREPLNNELDGRIVSRSMRAIGERVVPIGFPGLAFVYGIIAALTSVTLINYFTPIIVALSVVALFFAVEKRWGTWMGFVASTAYAFNPALWYYASRGLYPNALVVALTVIALSVPRLLAPMLALAVFVRPLELIWIAPLILWSYRTKSKQQISAVLGMALGLIAVLAANYWVYGSWIASGYSASLAAPNALTSAAPTIRATLGRIARFGLLLFPFHALLSITGAAWLIREKKYRLPLALLAILALIVSIPYAYFGARDIISLDHPSIGTSFVRYWLPAFLIGSAIMVVAMKEIQSKIAVGIALIAYIAVSFHAVWFGSLDSLAPILTSLRRYESVKTEVIALTEPQSLIIVEQADKVLFPDRRVVAWLRNPGTIEAIPSMLDHAPVYYFGLNLKPDEAERLGFEVVKMFEHETLYRATR